MPRRLVLALVLGAVAVPAAPAAAACPGADTAVTPLTLPAARAAVLCLVNAQRTSRGLGAVTQNARLQLAAQGHSDDMALRNYFSHDDPDGGDPGDRITAAGYAWQTYGENIAVGQATPADVMSDWMNSTGHRANILNPDFTELGVGISVVAATLPGGTGTWTQNFGRPMAGADNGGPGDPSGGTGTGTGTGTDTGTPSTDTPIDPAPGTTTTTTAPARMVVRFRRIGRRLVVTGRLTNSAATSARVTVTRAGRKVRSRRGAVRNGRYRIVLRLPSRAGAYTVTVRSGGLRVTRNVS